MNPAGEASLLRPLSLGEVFDRAVTLYVRNLGLFTAIALVLVVPVSVLRYFIGLHSGGAFAQVFDQLQHPGKLPVPDTSGVDGALSMATIAAGIVLNAFTMVAIARAVGALYRGEQPQWSACYLYALRRTGAVLLTLGCEILAFAAVFFAGAVAVGIVLGIGFVVMPFSGVLGVVALVFAGIAALAWICIVLLVYLAFAFGFAALAVEDTRAGGAMASGFARIFNRAELWRGVLVCLAFVVVYFGISFVSLGSGAVLESLKLHVVWIAIGALISLVATALVGVIVAVYYLDVRIRREGLDMHMEMERLHPIASAP